MKYISIYALTLLVCALTLWHISDPGSLRFQDQSIISFDEQGEVLSFFVNKQDNFHVRIDTPQIPALLRDLVVLYEDKRFFSHYGIDILAIARAWDKSHL